MGRNRGFWDTEIHSPSPPSSSSSSLSEDLLLATMYIVGLPVDVHVKDGSVYSGIFHTASMENEYGVVLKNAKMTRKGKMSANVAKGDVIETLIILSCDLVQVVSRGVLLPAAAPLIEAKKSRKPAVKERSRNNRTRQVGDDHLQGEPDDHGQKYEFQAKKSADEVQGLSSSKVDVNHEDYQITQAIVVEERNDSNEKTTSAITSPDVSAGVPSPPNQSVDLFTESSHRSVATTTKPAFSSDSNKNAKEFKLNPEAKIFSPSFANLKSETPSMPTVSNMSYIPSNSMVGPIPAPQPEFGFIPNPSRSPMPAKFSPWGSLTGGNGVNGSQYPQPIIGHVATRTQPLKYTIQYPPVQTTPSYVAPNSQAVMIGRLGQLVYDHPVSHDLVHAPTTMSPVYACSPLTSQQPQIPKHQGITANQALQMYGPPPFMAGANQPLALPSNIPVLHPPPSFPVHHPIQVQRSNNAFSTRFS